MNICRFWAIAKLLLKVGQKNSWALKISQSSRSGTFQGELTDPGAAHPELTWFESVKFCDDQIPGKSFLATIRNQVRK